MKEIEITASSYEDALAQALEQLGLTEDQVEAQIVKQSGLIRKKVTVKVTQKATPKDIAIDFINTLIQKMGLACTATIREEDDAYYVSLSGKDTATLIGYRGDVLDCVQYLTLLVVNKTSELDKRIIIDGENYREKRTIVLSKLAKKLAIKAAKTGKDVALEPMNPFERRVIHSALADDRFVTTESEGEEPNRYIVIKPNKRSFSDRPRRGGNGGGRYGSSNREGGKFNGGRQGGNRNGYGNSSAPVQKSEPKEEQPKDMYNHEYSINFKRTGGGKLRSFGEKKRTF